VHAAWVGELKECEGASGTGGKEERGGWNGWYSVCTAGRLLLLLILTQHPDALAWRSWALLSVHMSAAHSDVAAGQQQHD
jgi:hypothetical protein